MNCKDVEAVVNDLARDQMMDATMRESALSHAALCSSCTVLLEDARALTGAIRRLAEATDAEGAPARLEANLLAAFRGHHADPPRIRESRSAVASRRWPYAAAAIAAAAVIVIVISLMASRNSATAPDKTREAVVTPAQKHDEKSSPAASQPEPGPGLVVRSNHRGRVVGNDQRRKSESTSGDSESQDETEIATDFIPLVNRESLRELDSGQLVRVELPRSALMSFGLPVGMEHANDRVKADVVVGQDGLARAIRFVR